MEVNHQEPLTSLELHPRIHSALKKARFCGIKSVLHLSASDLVRRTGLSHSDVNTLLQAASSAVVCSSVPSATALQLYKNWQDTPNHGRLSTGCEGLDRCLHGGLLVPGINEIAGTSAAGKTQLCLQLCLTVQLPREHGGLHGSAVYVSTEDAFPSKRWQELAGHFASLYSTSLDLTAKKLSDNLYIEHAATTSSLSVLLQYKLPSMLSQHPVKLVVIDSLAALFRVEFGANQAVQRAHLLRGFGHRLRTISEKHSAAIVCVNQVTADMDGGRTAADAIKPALGLTWADIVTTRLMLTRPEGVDSKEDYQRQPKSVFRTLQVLLAPHLPQFSLHYCISSDGIKSTLNTT